MPRYSRSRSAVSRIASAAISSFASSAALPKPTISGPAVALEALAGIEHALVLGLDGDDVIALLLVEARGALDREVVGLGRTRGPHDLLGIAADQRGALRARILDRGLGGPAEHVVAARRVAVVLGEERQHRLDDARIDLGGRLVIHEDGELQRHQLFPSRKSTVTGTSKSLSRSGTVRIDRPANSGGASPLRWPW